MAVWKQGFAAEKAPFYQGKTLTFVINYAAGGPTDMEGTAVEPQMVKTGEVTALYYTDLVSPDGEIMVSADVPELLPFTHYYRQVFGKMPSGIKYEALKAATISSTNMTRLIMLPPTSPPEAVTTLR